MLEENNCTYKQVYLSKDDRPFEIWFAPKDAEVEWPYTEDVPDKSLKSPKYNWEKYCWIENDSTSKAQLIADLQKKVEAQDKQLEQMNKNQETSLTSISKNQAEMLKMMAPLLAKGGKANA